MALDKSSLPGLHDDGAQVVDAFNDLGQGAHLGGACGVVCHVKIHLEDVILLCG